MTPRADRSASYRTNALSIADIRSRRSAVRRSRVPIAEAGERDGVLMETAFTPDLDEISRESLRNPKTGRTGAQRKARA